MTEQDKVTVDDIIGIVKTEEQTNSVEEVRKLRGRENKTAKRFELREINEPPMVPKVYDAEKQEYANLFECVSWLNELHEENMNLRAKHTQMIIILKDVVNDLKRMDTYRYAEHLEKIANLHFLSEKEFEE